MHVRNIGYMILADDVAAVSNFYVTYFGFKPMLQLSWYASHEHPDHKGVFLDVLKKGHEAAGPVLSKSSTDGLLIAFTVEDLDTEYERLKDNVDIIMEPHDEPWGQRRFQVQAPEGVVIEVIQQIAPDMKWLKNNP